MKATTTQTLEETLTEIKDRLDIADAIRALHARVDTLSNEVAHLKNHPEAVSPAPSSAEQNKSEKAKTPEEIANQQQAARRARRGVGIATLLLIGGWMAWGL